MYAQAGFYWDPLARRAPSGATLPSSPTEGDWFLHTPTGRKVLMQYANGAWNPIISYGAMTIYVDTSGTNSQNNGTAAGASAFLTIQFAINQIPGLVGGNVIVNIGAGTFAETVVLRGKFYVGNFTIVINGTFTALDTLTAGVGSVAGTGSTQGTVVRSSGTWTVNQRKNKLVTFTSGVNSGERKVIDTNTTTTLTTCYIWNGGAPANGDSFQVQDWGTIVAPAAGVALTVGSGQTGVTVNNISFNPASPGQALLTEEFSNCQFWYCHFSASGAGGGGSITDIKGACLVFYSALPLPVGSATTGIAYVNNGGNASFLACKLDSNGVSGVTVLFYYNVAKGQVSAGTILVGEAATAVGLLMDSNSSCSTYSGDSQNKIRDCSTGINAANASFVFYAYNCDFSGCTTNQSPAAAADPSYIL